jgi:hypothetical protein
VVGGLIALVVVFAVASAAGFAMRRRQGRFSAPPVPAAPAGGVTAPPAPGSALSAGDLGVPLGTQATLVQFSTEVCAYCGPARKVLAEVAGQRDGVTFVEIDAAGRMELTRRLRIMSTPTVLVLDALGGVVSRSSGPQRRADVVAALDRALAPGGIAP